MASKHLARSVGTLSDPGLVTPSRPTSLDEDSFDSSPRGFASLSPQVRNVLDRNKRKRHALTEVGLSFDVGTSAEITSASELLDFYEDTGKNEDSTDKSENSKLEGGGD